MISIFTPEADGVLAVSVVAVSVATGVGEAGGDAVATGVGSIVTGEELFEFEKKTINQNSVQLFLIKLNQVSIFNA